MKRGTPIIAFLICLVANAAQATTYLSNLGEPSGNAEGLGFNHQIAQSFITGNAAINLNSVSIIAGTGGNFGTPSGDFVFSLFSDNNGMPSSSLGQLNGPNPSNGGPPPGGPINIFNYTASGITLSPFTTYWLVASSTSFAGGNAFYVWAYPSTTNYTSTDGWSINPAASIGLSTDGGATWSIAGGRNYYFEVNASVPEPATIMLSGLGLAAIVLSARRVRARH